MSQDLTSDDRKSKLSKWYKIGIAALVCLVVSPIIFLIVKGLVGLILAISLGFVAIQLAPWFSIKMATWSLKLIKQDAYDNPIETRQQIEQDTERQLSNLKGEIESFQANLSTFENQVRNTVERYPGKTQEYVEQVCKLEELLSLRKRMWQEARDNLKAYKEETIEISDLWDMANSAVKMNKMAGTMGSDPMKELRTRVANNSVHNRMNLAMAQLSTSLMEESATPSLPMSQPVVLQMKERELMYVQNNR